MLNIHLRSTGERFTLKSIHYDTKVRELKTILEIICGIPAHLQLLSYLDEGNLVDSQKLKYYDPVPNCTFELDVWFIYEPIVQAVVANNETKVTKSSKTRRYRLSKNSFSFFSSVYYPIVHFPLLSPIVSHHRIRKHIFANEVVLRCSQPHIVRD